MTEEMKRIYRVFCKTDRENWTEDFNNEEKAKNLVREMNRYWPNPNRLLGYIVLKEFKG